MIRKITVELLTSFLLTAALELAAGWAAGMRRKYELEIIFLANLATNPLVVAFYQITIVFAGYRGAGMVLAAGEFLAWAGEGFIYKKSIHGCRRPYLFSLMANLLSFAAGVLINYIR